MTHFKSYFTKHFILDNITIVSNPKGITHILFQPSHPNPSLTSCTHTQNALIQLEQFFAGRRTQFDLSILPDGNLFQLRVWHILINIPYGSTKTYEDIALALGSRTLSHAVKQACEKNPIPILIPCHRAASTPEQPQENQAHLDKRIWIHNFEMQHVANLNLAAPL